MESLVPVIKIIRAKSAHQNECVRDEEPAEEGVRSTGLTLIPITQSLSLAF